VCVFYSFQMLMNGCVRLQGLMVLLQSLPTEDWTDEEVGLVLADAYRLKFTFADAPKHLSDATS